MTKPLIKKDFRAVRFVLEPSDFALGPELPDPPPTDLISKKTWNHIVGLPDDVAVRTSNHHGAVFAEVCELKDELVCVLLTVQGLKTRAGCDLWDSPICHVLCSGCDELAGSIYNALTGHYRLAFSALRNVLEHFSIGLQLELSGDSARFKSWLNGSELGFGWAADHAPKNEAVGKLEAYLRAALADDLFAQKSALGSGGFARRLFGKLSKYTHGGPGFADGDMWKSNGPVYVPEAVVEWATAFRQVYTLCLVLCRLAQPNLQSLGKWSKMSVRGLFERAAVTLRGEDDGTKLFQNLPPNYW